VQMGGVARSPLGALNLSVNTPFASPASVSKAAIPPVSTVEDDTVAVEEALCNALQWSALDTPTAAAVSTRLIRMTNMVVKQADCDKIEGSSMSWWGIWCCASRRPESSSRGRRRSR
jgi:hypothetical protein